MVEDNILLNKEFIYKSNINKDICKDAVDFISQIKNTFSERSWDCEIITSLNTTNNLLNVENLHTLKMHILSHIHQYMYQRKEFFDGYIDSSWANIYKKTFYQEYHDHVNDVAKYISGVMYLTENNSDISFSLKSSERFKHTPQFSEILIFEDYIPHRVHPNENEELRISLAFNYKKMDKWKGIDFVA